MKKKNVLIILLMILSLTFAGCVDEKTGTAIVKYINQADDQMTNTSEQVQSGNIQYYFTKSGQHPDEQLIKVINSSRNTLDIAIYSLTKQDIVDAIINAKNRGVTVRVMTDRGESKSKYESKELKKLKKDGIPVKVNTHPGLLHLKMTVADKKIGTTGSFNYTENASKENDEMLVIINNSKVASDFDNEFENMWNNNAEYEYYN